MLLQRAGHPAIQGQRAPPNSRTQELLRPLPVPLCHPGKRAQTVKDTQIQLIENLRALLPIKQLGKGSRCKSSYSQFKTSILQQKSKCETVLPNINQCLSTFLFYSDKSYYYNVMSLQFLCPGLSVGAQSCRSLRNPWTIKEQVNKDHYIMYSPSLERTRIML